MADRRPNPGFRRKNGTVRRLAMAQGSVPGASASTDWTVTDEWPAAVPISPNEIDVIETFMAEILTELLDRSPNRTKRCLQKG